MTGQRIAKWTRWIEGDVTNEVINLNHHRQIFERVSEIIDAHGALPDSAFWPYLRDTYGIFQAVAIRRLIDRSDASASLRNLIAEIAEDAASDGPPRLTRDFWLGIWGETNDPVERSVANKQWDEHYGGSTGDHLDPAIPAADLERLTTLTKPIKDYVDKHVCHIDRNRPEPTVTMDELHEASVVVGDLFAFYASLLTAKGWVQFAPVIQHDWEAVFREPWIREADRPDR
jgi:hypothetical protein